MQNTRRLTHKIFHTGGGDFVAGSAKVLSCLVFVLSSLVLSCPALSCPVLAPFPVPTWPQLGPKLGPQIHQNPEKMESRRPSHVDFFFISIFVYFFASMLSSLEPPESLKFYRFYKCFWLVGFFKIRSILDVIFVPTWVHFASQNLPKSLPKSIPRCIIFSIDFGIDF